MAKNAAKVLRRRKALAKLRELASEPSTVRIVHYSCGDFTGGNDGVSARITSIAVRNWGTGQTTSFSLHLALERSGQEPAHADLDELEREILQEWFDYARINRDSKWLHWNMRDTRFGFGAIEHRMQVLGGEPFLLNETSRYNLASYLIDIYGPGYVPNPRMTSLMIMNEAAHPEMLSGADEAEAFTRGEFLRLHQSTLRKVEAFDDILEMQRDGTLKTHASLWDQYGRSVLGFVEMIAEHWTYKLAGAIAIVITIILGAQAIL